MKCISCTKLTFMTTHNKHTNLTQQQLDSSEGGTEVSISSQF